MPRTVKKRRPTMRDVADFAGVSQTTVSFIINEVGGISIPEETRQRVWAAVEQLGYRRNAVAHGLRTDRTSVLGFITDEIATTPFAGKIVQGAQDAAWENGKILFLINTGKNPAIEKTAIEMMLERKVEGIIYATMYHRAVNPPDTIREVPTVLLDCFSRDHSLPSVVPDEVGGARTATEALLEKGHRRIGFLNNVDPIPATFGRLEGYKQALANYGVPFDASLVACGESQASGGYRCTLSLMQSTNPPTAIFCFNDRMAMGAYDALRKLNFRIPDDIAVIGFDNQEIIAEQLHPALSTIELPHYQMGWWAVKYLVEHGGAEAMRPVQHVMECPLIRRESF
ncbi:MAG: LacI family DNA-binding transcriptional regulator [Anaerolineae bacterium]